MHLGFESGMNSPPIPSQTSLHCRDNKINIKTFISDEMMFLVGVNCTGSPVEAHALYDGQLVPLGERRRLVLAGLCW